MQDQRPRDRDRAEQAHGRGREEQDMPAPWRGWSSCRDRVLMLIRHGQAEVLWLGINYWASRKCLARGAMIDARMMFPPPVRAFTNVGAGVTPRRHNLLQLPFLNKRDVGAV